MMHGISNYDIQTHSLQKTIICVIVIKCFAIIDFPSRVSPIIYAWVAHANENFSRLMLPGRDQTRNVRLSQGKTVEWRNVR